MPTITDIPEMLRTFSSRILDYQPHSWITHVSGHPPGALLTFVWLDRIGMSGGAWAGAFCVLVGSSAATAVIVAVRAVSDEATARMAAPFVAVAPTAIWIAVSADAYFTGVAAWGIALLALAASRTVRWPIAVAAGAGLLLGWAIFLNYGLALMGLLALAVLIAVGNRRSALATLAAAVPAAVAVAVAFAVAGFWWFDGYTLVQQRYWQGIAMNRPFQYWGWANLASVACAIGLGSVAGLGRVFDIAAIRGRSGLHLLVLAAIGRDSVRRPEHAQQSRNRTHLAAVHGVDDRGPGAPPSVITALVAGRQRRRRSRHQPFHPDELVDDACTCGRRPTAPHYAMSRTTRKVPTSEAPMVIPDRPPDHWDAGSAASPRRCARRATASMPAHHRVGARRRRRTDPECAIRPVAAAGATTAADVPGRPGRGNARPRGPGHRQRLPSAFHPGHVWS